MKRFKTAIEFVKEFGGSWRDKLKEDWTSPDMDSLFGKKTEDLFFFTHKKDGRVHETVYVGHYGFFDISDDMLTDREPEDSKPEWVAVNCEPEIDRQLLERLEKRNIEDGKKIKELKERFKKERISLKGRLRKIERYFSTNESKTIENRNTLLKLAYENNKCSQGEIDWNNASIAKYYLRYGYLDNKVKIYSSHSIKDQGTVYFLDEDKFQKEIDYLMEEFGIDFFKNC